eukprot:CAMPEP_0202769670 /NCGR_PEP_ID=MMETSP1388-20130828/37161_1 /ASSEMBLY_ACC=CAM_ASM_000864 /TAXON_ID=37098 /ORGANISM="Isochrysis sp, Strain CCMP1244" /LENGTH=134 /DNA_ID=CAMNT_0049438463 /DNA_START=76 /DNA_END=480 /DNA_ORIENTATION=-
MAASPQLLRPAAPSRGRQAPSFRRRRRMHRSRARLRASQVAPGGFPCGLRTLLSWPPQNAADAGRRCPPLRERAYLSTVCLRMADLGDFAPAWAATASEAGGRATGLPWQGLKGLALRRASLRRAERRAAASRA